ncbi:hypothetical protein Rs2_38668 [Raphanus sativus]|nr:hypothetical protein Rs2_38668 [Raphanus sativus]
MECLRPFSNSFRTPNLVHSPIRVTSPGFNTLSPSLQSPNMFTNSSSQIIHPIPIPNDATQEMVENSGGANAKMMISNNNPPHQPTDVDLPLQKGTGDIPTEQSVDITSLESNADPIGARLLLSFDSTVVAEMDAMNLISLKSGIRLSFISVFILKFGMNVCATIVQIGNTGVNLCKLKSQRLRD